MMDKITVQHEENQLVKKNWLNVLIFCLISFSFYMIYFTIEYKTLNKTNIDDALSIRNYFEIDMFATILLVYLMEFLIIKINNGSLFQFNYQIHIINQLKSLGFSFIIILFFDFLMIMNLKVFIYNIISFCLITFLIIIGIFIDLTHNIGYKFTFKRCDKLLNLAFSLSIIIIISSGYFQEINTAIFGFSTIPDIPNKDNLNVLLVVGLLCFFMFNNEEMKIKYLNSFKLIFAIFILSSILKNIYYFINYQITSDYKVIVAYLSILFWVNSLVSLLVNKNDKTIVLSLIVKLLIITAIYNKFFSYISPTSSLPNTIISAIIFFLCNLYSFKVKENIFISYIYCILLTSIGLFFIFNEFSVKTNITPDKIYIYREMIPSLLIVSLYIFGSIFINKITFKNIKKEKIKNLLKFNFLTLLFSNNIPDEIKINNEKIITKQTFNLVFVVLIILGLLFAFFRKSSINIALLESSVITILACILFYSRVIITDKRIIFQSNIFLISNIKKSSNVYLIIEYDNLEIIDNNKLKYFNYCLIRLKEDNFLFYILKDNDLRTLLYLYTMGYNQPQVIKNSTF